MKETAPGLLWGYLNHGVLNNNVYIFLIKFFDELTSVRSTALVWRGDNSIYSNYPYHIKVGNHACRFRGLTAQ